MQYNLAMEKRNNPISFRLSAEAMKLIKQMADQTGLSQAAVIEVAVRELSKTGKVELLKVPQ